MIDAGDDSEYLSASETLGDDNYVPQTTAKIRHSLSLNKEKAAPLATKSEKKSTVDESVEHACLCLDGHSGSILKNQNSPPKKTTKPVFKSFSV